MNKENRLYQEEAHQRDQSIIVALCHMLFHQQNEIDRLRSKLQTVKHDLIHDPLTKLKTRSYFLEQLNIKLAKMKYPQKERRAEHAEIKHLSLLFIDIDRFKKINDTLGHSVGDRVLQTVADILNSNVRQEDIVARLGGEEIVISLIGAEEQQATAKAEELRILVNKEIKVQFATIYPDLNCTLSIGVASATSKMSADQLIRQADQAMYAAKKTGKNRVRSFSSLTPTELTLIQSPVAK